MSDLAVFCRQVRARSAEHRLAIAALTGMPGQHVSILRQEIDSLVRVIFILSQSDDDYRKLLLGDSVSGRRWTRIGRKQHVTDKEMVEIADRLQGWTKSVYSFGCAFIHLSKFHDYGSRDPLSDLTSEERTATLEHLRRYHGGPAVDNPTFADIVPYLPLVFEKIASNLEYYVVQLESGSTVSAPQKL
jgi:hypothetical protein